MDDLRLNEKNNEEGLLSTIKIFSYDICIKFGLDKCTKATFIKRRLTSASQSKVDYSTSIRELHQQETYRYLGINEGNGIQYAKMKEKIKKSAIDEYKLSRNRIKCKKQTRSNQQASNIRSHLYLQYLKGNLENKRRME